MKKRMMVFAGMMVVAAAQPALAHEHGHMDGDMHNPCSMHMDGGMHMNGSMENMKGGFQAEKDIDGYNVSFHIMKAPAGKEQGGSHHVMVKFEKDGKVVSDLVANSKAEHPNGESESKMLMKMGDWYMAAYDLGHAGKHQVMVLFKTSDGKKHFGGVGYPEPQKINHR
jgi:hypothetical protein